MAKIADKNLIRLVHRIQIQEGQRLKLCSCSKLAYLADFLGAVSVLVRAVSRRPWQGSRPRQYFAGLQGMSVKPSGRLPFTLLRPPCISTARSPTNTNGRATMSFKDGVCWYAQKRACNKAVKTSVVNQRTSTINKRHIDVQNQAMTCRNAHRFDVEPKADIIPVSYLYLPRHQPL